MKDVWRLTITLLITLTSKICLMNYVNGSKNTPLHLLNTSPSRIGHLRNAQVDYSKRISVNVGDVLTQRAFAAASLGGYNVARSPLGTRSAENPTAKAKVAESSIQLPSESRGLSLSGDKSWHPAHADTFARVNVRMFGEKINGAALAYLKPKQVVRSTHKLRTILGDDFDDKWMSIVKPLNENWSQMKDNISPPHDLITLINDQNFSVAENGRAEDGLKYFTKKETEIIKEWLLQKAICKMEYTWKDLGEYFWPRWNLQGLCKNTQSCSWPPGLYCHPSNIKSLTILRWLCKRDTNTQRLQRHVPLQRVQYRIFNSVNLYNYDSQYSQYYQRRQRNRQNFGFRRKRMSRDKRQSRRIKRLVRQMSISDGIHYCSWVKFNRTLYSECSCSRPKLEI